MRPCLAACTIVSLSGAALAQPILPVTEVLPSVQPVPGAPDFTTTPTIDVSASGFVAVFDNATFTRNVYAGVPGAFTRFAQFPIQTTLPSGRTVNNQFAAGWAAGSAQSSAITGLDVEFALVSTVANQTVTPHLWTAQALPGLPAGVFVSNARITAGAVTDSGFLAARATLQGPGINGENAYVIVTNLPSPRILFRGATDPLQRPTIDFTISAPPYALEASSGGYALFPAFKRRNNATLGHALLLATPTHTRPLLEPDAPIPGFPANTTITQLSTALGLSASGDCAFIANLSPPAAPSTLALFRTTGGPESPLTLAFRAGDPVPAAGPGVTGVISPVSGGASGAFCPLSDFGDIAIELRLSGPNITSLNDYALVCMRDNQLHLVCREGDPVPGLPGVTFRDPQGVSPTGVFMNARRQLLLYAQTSAGFAFCSWSPSRGLQTLAYTGRPVTFRGEPRAMAAFAPPAELVSNVWLRASGGADGRRTILDDHGNAYLWARVGNNQGALYHATLPSPCLADFNDDGIIDGFDDLDFAQAFETSDPTLPSADVNNDGFLDFFDYDRFVTVFEAGC